MIDPVALVDVLARLEERSNYIADTIDRVETLAKETNGRVRALEVTSARHDAEIAGMQRAGPRATDADRDADAKRWRSLAAVGRLAVSKPALALYAAAAGLVGIPHLNDITKVLMGT